MRNVIQFVQLSEAVKSFWTPGALQATVGILIGNKIIEPDCPSEMYIYKCKSSDDWKIFIHQQLAIEYSIEAEPLAELQIGQAPFGEWVVTHKHELITDYSDCNSKLLLPSMSCDYDDVCRKMRNEANVAALKIWRDSNFSHILDDALNVIAYSYNMKMSNKYSLQDIYHLCTSIHADEKAKDRSILSRVYECRADD